MIARQKTGGALQIIVANNRKGFFMKNYLKFFALVAMFVTIGFLTFSCDGGDKHVNNNSLEGSWGRSNCTFVFNSKTNTIDLSSISSGSAWGQARTRGYINLGDSVFRYIKASGERTWTGEERLLGSNYQPAGWYSCTLTLSADGQTLTSFCLNSTTQKTYYNRK